jgi:pyruvate dehydrogenase E2 component (dihydrolipoamide acetyltransferase)
MTELQDAVDSGTGLRHVPYDRFRRVTSRRMTASVTTKPQVTLHRYANVTALERALAEARTSQAGSSLGFTAALLAALARGLGGSRLNGTVTDQVIVLHEGVHLGVAVDVEGSLVVPVVRDAHLRSVVDIGAELTRLAGAARSATLRPEEVDGATFTVTSLGALGVELFTPIINPPQLAILGVGSVNEYVSSSDGVIATARRIGLSLSFDHGATDGADAARALDTLCQRIENPDIPWIDADLVAPASH